ncbi:protein of unknown function UPF0157 [Desulfofarcimen acetoxidans DSM 771]|uniref:N-acetyltransferase domain-containing protein n=1 Tax=Desulfofarcimen acetoxidans (strain ATCC 49208 / DSM 771 / KCTC 5769 / VKM B-1644 / 5575) TaxID=485916 RepID=C8W1B5_DESAS|nr:protein of unknown function UPF0157 [Desulfofarcimen acetoxidans DSM 771]
MNIALQPAATVDAEAMAAIQKKAFKRLYDIYHDEGNPFLRGVDEIMHWLERPNWKVFKIFADGILVGSIAACERNGRPGECYLARLYVLPEMQGKGIASRAVLLCESKFPNASHWSLDFPADQPANRRCYEKAGYWDTGETREQSEGKITLALYEKRIPAFHDIKQNMDHRAALFPIVLREYNPAYPRWFAEEKANLTRLVGAENIERISHYGSTAVPGLLAKPTVDILLEIKPDTDIDRLKAALPEGEYVCLQPPALTIDEQPPHLMILKGYTPCGFAEKVFHIHVRYAGRWDELIFRDYLIAHPGAAAEYAALKRELFKRFELDRDGYTEAKSAFIREVTERAKE